MSSIFAELKRRRVYRVALAYGVIASGLIQVGGTILPIFHAPDWAQQVFVVLIAVGFAVSFVSAWIVVKTFLGYVQRHGFSLFAWWRVVVGASCLRLLALGQYVAFNLHFRA